MLYLVTPTIRPGRIKGSFLPAWSSSLGEAGLQWRWYVVPDPALDRDAAHSIGLSVTGRQVLGDLRTAVLLDQYEPLLGTVLSQQSAACRGLGLLHVAADQRERLLFGHDVSQDLVLLLDDDVLPGGTGAVRRWLEYYRASYRRGWLDVLDPAGHWRQRGVPYSRGTLQPGMVQAAWSGVPDLDGPTQLVAERGVGLAAVRVQDAAVLVPPGVWPAISAMALLFDAALLPVAWQGLQGQGQPFARFDDIWSGMLMALACELAGRGTVLGPVLVYHQRASDPLANLEAEAAGIAEHDRYVVPVLMRQVREEALAAWQPEPDRSDVLGQAARLVGQTFASVAARTAGESRHTEYWQRVAAGMSEWLNLVRLEAGDGDDDER